MLLIVCGLQGTGKTWVAGRISEQNGATLLRTDVVRKELLSATTYSSAEIQNVYSETIRRAKELLKQGQDVILEATFSKSENRDLAREAAMEAGAEFHLVEVVCDEAVVEERLRLRHNDASDADFQIYLKYKPLFETITEDHIIIDNSGTEEETDRQIGDLIKAL